MCCANWLIGRLIVEAEQRGARRAGYGQALLKSLSAQLSSEYGSGFSVSARCSTCADFTWPTPIYWRIDTRCVSISTRRPSTPL